MPHQHACKLINFYNTCKKNYKLRYTNLLFNRIIAYLKELQAEMAKDADFWKKDNQQSVNAIKS